jgi:hypothetical protein
MSTIGILTVATNRYIEYWKVMVLSVQENLFPCHDLTFYVFTDQTKNLADFSNLNPQLDLKILGIEPLGWPEATLLRYEIYERYSDSYTEDFLMHLDADMIATSSAESIFLGENWSSGMMFVAHPGYWREPSKRARLAMYFKTPELAIRDLYRYLRLGAIGAWETNDKSMAHVPRERRKNYACGGIWLGERGPFLGFITKMASHVRTDLSIGYIAKWHDESHLNWWVSTNQNKLQPPNLCHDNSFKNLRNIEGIITAVRK